MERPFRVDEILLGEVSGQVLGTFSIDPQWGVIESVHGHAFEFRNHRTGDPITLDAAGQRAAMNVVEAALAAEADLSDTAGVVNLSGRRPSMRMAQDSAGQKTLAKFLSSAKPANRWSVRRAE